jgi:3' terminal RNA ribose 2'-O-methyltransferase Hen1
VLLTITHPPTFASHPDTHPPTFASHPDTHPPTFASHPDTHPPATDSTAESPATDLGYLLVKHPDRVHRFDLPAGSAYVCFPEATPRRCTAALILEVDARRLTARHGRGGRPAAFALQQHVNDRPYAASSLLAVALNRAFRSALRGECKERPQLAATPIPLEVRIPVLPCDGDGELVRRMFAPLGWTVAAAPIPLDSQYPEWGASHYVDLTLTGTLRLRDALNHLYVLLPVLDDAKHYWVALDEVDKLIRAGGGWLANHPERDLIARRYLAHRRFLAEEALSRLTQPPTDETAAATGEEPEDQVPFLAERRRAAVLAALEGSGARRVLDLGCGSGALLADLVRDQRYTEIVGVDIDTRALDLAERRLGLDRLPPRQRERIKLWQSALTYADDRLRGFDAAILMEVVEHVDLVRLPALESAVFGHASPGTVIVTTPNAEYNVRYEGLAAGRFRHPDHRFEWTRHQFAEWASRVADRYRYQVKIEGVGESDPRVGAPSQLAVFRR